MGAEQLDGRRRAHFRRDDAREVCLQADGVDDRQTPGAGSEQAQASGERLILPPLPMELNADGHVAQKESAAGYGPKHSVTAGREPPTVLARHDRLIAITMGGETPADH